MGALAISSKLRIREGNVLRTINAPGDFKKSLGELPKGVKITEAGKDFNQLHWFVKTKAEMKKELKKVMEMIRGEVVCWIYYPKGSSGIQTDLTRDTGWEELMKQDKQWISLISFNETWSAFGLREKTNADRKKESKPKERPIFEYADSKNKTITIPADLEAAFKKNKKAQTYFQSIAFSHKREYIEWIVTAKREETREKRVKETIKMLSRNFKNPGEAKMQKAIGNRPGL